jgi:hypothetical protein
LTATPHCGKPAAAGAPAWTTAEKIEAALEAKDREIADLRARLQKLEESNGY